MPIDHRTHDQLARSLAELDREAYVRHHGRYHPSPDSWQDQILYFLMLDRFSDGNERGTVADANGDLHDVYLDNDGARVAGGTTPPFDLARDAYTADRQRPLVRRHAQGPHGQARLSQAPRSRSTTARTVLATSSPASTPPTLGSSARP